MAGLAIYLQKAGSPDSANVLCIQGIALSLHSALELGCVREGTGPAQDPSVLPVSALMSLFSLTL